MIEVVVSNYTNRGRTTTKHGEFRKGGYELSVRKFEEEGKSFYDRSEGLVKKYTVMNAIVDVNSASVKADVFKLNGAVYNSKVNADIKIVRRMIRGEAMFFMLSDESIKAYPANERKLYTLYRISPEYIVWR